MDANQSDYLGDGGSCYRDSAADRRPIARQYRARNLSSVVREQLIVMFLDLADSTPLAEKLGGLRVHDLISRFFFDIDEPINDHGGSVLSYVGDEVIVTWSVADDPARNARCLACFFAIETKIAGLSNKYTLTL